jgi:hypothetical protein
MDALQGDDMSRDQILLNWLALVESRLQALAQLCAIGTDEAGDSGVPPALLIDAESQLELANGFYLREWDAHGNAFRWAGRGDYFGFRFFLDRRSARSFSMRGALAAGCDPADLRAYADYRPVPVELRPDGEMLEILGRIPADPLGTGVTLTFFCSPVPPAGADSRRLSFAFSSLAIGVLASSAAGAPEHGMRGYA